MIQNLIRKYGVIVLLYLAVIGGVLMLSSRLRYLNQKQVTTNNITINK